MNLKFVKKLIKKYGVKSWVESGVNVCEVCDKFEDCNYISWLDNYEKYGWLKFCSSLKECICGHCGGIELNNGQMIYYNII